MIFEAKFPHIDKELVLFLKKILTFNPLMRPSAKECLANPIFDSLRVKALEDAADIKIKMEMDDLDMFDYEECIDHLPI